MSSGPYNAEQWVLVAPDITGDPDRPAGVVHFDEEGYLTLVQCPHVTWGMDINEILLRLNAKDSLFDEAPEISSNFFAQTNNLIERYEQDYPKVLKRTLEKDHHIFVLKYEDTQTGSIARDILDNFHKSAHSEDENPS